MSGCDAELCEYWAGHGCVCDALGIDPDERDACEDCGCPEDDHNADVFGGGCTSCGIDCGGFR